jgi:hypothetical protein
VDWRDVLYVFRLVFRLVPKVTTPLRLVVTMTSPKLTSPPSEPPDSLPSPSVETSETQYVDPGGKNSVISSPEMGKSTFSAKKTSQQPLYTYDIDVEVANCADGAANGAQLLSEIVCALTKMNKNSSVLLLNSKSDNNKIDGDTKFPTKSSELKIFVNRYIGGLRLTPKFSMKGKITVRTSCKFSALKKSKSVQTFLKGAWSGSKSTPVSFLLHKLKCSARHQVGLFLNTIVRHDLVQSMTQRIRSWFDSVKNFPPIQVEITAMYHGKKKAEYLRIMAAEKDVKVVEKALLQLLPVPSAKMSFISSTTWGELTPAEKLHFHDTHLRFQEFHSSLVSKTPPLESR